MVLPYDTEKIINRIIQNLRLDIDIFSEDSSTGKKTLNPGKIITILFGEPEAHKLLGQVRPYISITPGEPFELTDEPVYTSRIGEESPQSKITLQFFITCVVDGILSTDTLSKDLFFRGALKNFFKANPKMRDPEGNDPLFHKSYSTITPKLIRATTGSTLSNVSAFTIILQAEILSV